MQNIEQATVEDAEEILRLQKLAYISEAEIYDDHAIPPLVETLEDIKNAFRDHVFLKALKDGAIVGSVRARLTEGTCEIGRFIVHPDFQNQGIGTKLMNEIEGNFSDAIRFELFTGDRSQRNLHLYKKLGYQEFKRVRVAEDVELIYLEKPSSGYTSDT